MKTKPPRRQIFVFTAEEKKVAAVVAAALALGFATLHYRATHPTPPRPLTAQEARAAKLAQRTAAAKARSTRTAHAIKRATPLPVETDDD